MDFKEKNNDELSEMSVHELAGYYNTLNEVKSAEIDMAIDSKSSKKEVAELYATYKSESEAQAKKLNEALVEQGLEIKKLKESELKNHTVIATSVVKNGLSKNIDNLKGLKGSLKEAKESEFSLSVKAPMMTYQDGSAPLGQLPQSYREPGVYDQRRSTLGFLPYVAQTFISSNVVSWVEKEERENEANFTPEGEVKPASKFTLVVNEAFVVKYANYIKVSTEMLDDISFLEGEIDRELIGNVLEKVDKDCFTGAGNGIQGLTSIGAQFGAGTFSQSVAAPNLIDVLVVAAAQIGANYYRADRIFLNPLDVAELRVTKDTDNNYLNRLMITAGTLVLDGIPIVETYHVAAGSFVIADMTQLRMYVKEDMQLEFGLDGNDFTQNMRTILTEWRGILRCPKNAQDKAIIHGIIEESIKELAQAS